MFSYYQNKTDSGSDDDTECKRESSATKLNLEATAFQVIGLAWPENTHSQGNYYTVSNTYNFCSYLGSLIS